MIVYPHRSRLRPGRTSVAGMGYFITKCVHNPNLVALNQPEIAKILIDSFQWMITHDYTKVGGFVIMPFESERIMRPELIIFTIIQSKKVCVKIQKGIYFLLRIIDIT